MEYSLTESWVRHYPKNIGDWMAATAHLSSVEECMYSRLIDQYYQREAPLPLDIVACCRLARATSGAERKAVAIVVPEYFEERTDGWHQKRCDREIAAYQERSASASLSAQIGWEKRAANAMRTHSQRNANALETQCDGNATRGHANQEPRTKNQEPSPLSYSESVGEGASAPHGPNGKEKKPRGSRLPPDWRLPDEWRDHAVSLYHVTPQQAVRESLKFRDYFLGVAGEKGIKLDWQATWRNWCARCDQRGEWSRG